MVPVEPLVAVLVLLAAVAAGTVAHELSHAAALSALGIRCDVEWLPSDATGGLAGAVLTGRLAVVHPRALPSGVAPWRLRVAAMAPLALALPFALVPAGLLPDPLAAGSLPLAMGAIGWLACALPSPQDFSVLWHAERALADRAAG